MMRIPSLSFATPRLVAGGSVLDGGVAGVVLVLVGLSHGVGSRVYAVEDNEARDVEGPHGLGDGRRELPSEKRHCDVR
jgi:hypothetical protein